MYRNTDMKFKGIKKGHLSRYQPGGLQKIAPFSGCVTCAFSRLINASGRLKYHFCRVTYNLNVSGSFRRTFYLLEVRDINFFCSSLQFIIVLYCINGLVIAALTHCDLFRSIVLPRI